MAEFKPIDIKKYLSTPPNKVDKTDKTSEQSDQEGFVSFVKPVSGESSEKNNQRTEVEGHDSAADRSTPELGLCGPILLNLLRWIHKFNELILEDSSGMTVDATPEAALELINTYPWGVVYDPERYLLLSWGDVPTVTLSGLRDLETGELLIPEQEAAV